jgi:hypothetical protein
MISVSYSISSFAGLPWSPAKVGNSGSRSSHTRTLPPPTIFYVRLPILCLFFLMPSRLCGLHSSAHCGQGVSSNVHNANHSYKW